MAREAGNGFYRIFFIRLASGLASGIAYSIYRSINHQPHIWSVIISTAFLAIGIVAFQLAYYIIARPDRRIATRYILTQIAAHYIGSLIMI